LLKREICVLLPHGKQSIVPEVQSPKGSKFLSIPSDRAPTQRRLLVFPKDRPVAPVAREIVRTHQLNLCYLRKNRDFRARLRTKAHEKFRISRSKYLTLCDQPEIHRKCGQLHDFLAFFWLDRLKFPIISGSGMGPTFTV
jgi:hypothetical protein